MDIANIKQPAGTFLGISPLRGGISKCVSELMKEYERLEKNLAGSTKPNPPGLAIARGMKE
jgi:hypothetical protein